VEDAAEAHGARYRGEKVGALGDCASFSFFGNKIITTGEGGAVTTNDDDLAERMRLLRSQGMDPNRRYWFNVVGYNYRMTNVTAAIGLAQMERIDQALAFRKRLAMRYDEVLTGIEGVTLPFVADWAEHSYWMYTIKLSAGAKISRDEFMRRLADEGIETRPVFHPMHVLPPYAQDGRDFPNATECGALGVNLPTHEKMSDEDVNYIARSLVRALA
jgi:perosamine synthetase